MQDAICDSVLDDDDEEKKIAFSLGIPLYMTAACT